MKRYITKQKDKYSCGPISIINLAKWAGKNYTFKNIKEIRKALKCTPKTGTFPTLMEKYLKNNFGNDYKIKKLSICASVGELKSYLEKECSILLRIFFRSENKDYDLSSHLFFIAGLDKDNNWICPNGNGKFPKLLSIEQIYKYVYDEEAMPPTAYIISRKGK